MIHPQTFSTAQLHALHRRLAHTLAGLDDQLSQLASQREAAFQRAAAQGEPTLRKRLAHQILLLDRRARLLQTQQTLAQRQIHLLEQLVLAKGQAGLARMLEGSATDTGVDWLDVLAWVATTRRGLKRHLRLVDDLLAWLEGLVDPLPDAAPGPGSEWARVARVSDGDGAVLEDGRRVRYLGIDAPELNIHGRPESYALEARDANRALVAGKEVRLERDRSDADRYGRLLRYVWMGDTLVNADLVRRGWAYAFPVPPDTRHQALFERLERDARRGRRGLWAA